MRIIPRWTSVALFLFAILVLANGCRQPDAATATADYQEVTIEVSNMACAEGCAPRAKEALTSLPWAKDVKVDFETKKATFKAEAARYDEDAIIKVLTDEGFEGKILK